MIERMERLALGLLPFLVAGSVLLYVLRAGAGS